MQEHKVLGIIGCYGLSDQIVHLINRDPSIDRLFVINNPEGLRFTKKLGKRSSDKDVLLVDKDYVLEQEYDGFSVLIWLNPEDLHNQPAEIQMRQDEILSRLTKQVDSVFFCYGLCRSPEHRIVNLIKHAAKPVTFLTDANGEIVDDCFGAVIGGKKAYLETILRNKGTLFATTGYVEAWNKKHELMDIESMVYEVEQLKTLFEALDYRRIIRLDDGVGDRLSFEEDVQAFARTFDMELVSTKCQMKVFERSYDLAKGKMGMDEKIEMDEMPMRVESSSNFEANFSAWSLLDNSG